MVDGVLGDDCLGYVDVVDWFDWGMCYGWIVGFVCVVFLGWVGGGIDFCGYVVSLDCWVMFEFGVVGGDGCDGDVVFGDWLVGCVWEFCD